jgi:RimJ/RimL family protein N-acetyltransferase
MELRGKHSVVRPWRMSDASSLARHANNENVSRHLRDRFPHPYTAADARRFLDSVNLSRPVTSFAIAVEGAGVGGIGFSAGVDGGRFSAGLGDWLGEAFWGRGIATEALRLVSDYAFRECLVLRLFALPFADNARSIRALEKAGYEKEGILRSSSVKFGAPRDQALYSLINPEWRFPTRP